MVAIERAFHGRTDRPAQISHSCKDGYDKNLNTFQDRDNLVLIPANDISALRETFNQADVDGVFIELLAIEPVQGEGAPGLCIDREFYDEARRLTKEHGSMLLIIDSVQAGLRGQGCLSIVDYDGFLSAEAPDMEAWSKAITAGQFPLSVVGMTAEVADLYVTGIYGNTMTTNPRALETAIAVLERITPELRQNIRDRGDELVLGLQGVMEKFPLKLLPFKERVFWSVQRWTLISFPLWEMTRSRCGAERMGLESFMEELTLSDSLRTFRLPLRKFFAKMITDCQTRSDTLSQMKSLWSLLRATV